MTTKTSREIACQLAVDATRENNVAIEALVNLARAVEARQYAVDASNKILYKQAGFDIGKALAAVRRLIPEI